MVPLPIREGVYRTAPGATHVLARLSPGCVFYPRILSVVWRAGAKAKRGQYDDREWSASSLTTLRALEAAGVQFEISGLDHVANLDGPCVFIGNHMSTLETFILPVLLLPYTRATFVVKQSLLDYPVFGHVMRSRDPIAVGRANAREDLQAVLEGGVERLRRGLSMIIFPQTTRTPRFDPAEFNSIGVKLAKKAAVPVIPIALKTDAWGNGRLLKDFGRIDPSKRVHLAFGPPMWLKDRGGDEHRAIIRFISAKLAEWGGSVAG
jgi:1-acyl-sn-glycerol-3-phosphate acyltransferase